MVTGLAGGFPGDHFKIGWRLPDPVRMPEPGRLEWVWLSRLAPDNHGPAQALDFGKDLFDVLPVAIFAPDSQLAAAINETDEAAVTIAVVAGTWVDPGEREETRHVGQSGK